MNPRVRPVGPIPIAEVQEWTATADVVVIGYGVAGACAALEAATHGADVLVLERAGSWGGAASLSGGFIYMGGGTALQRACGFEDSPDEMFKFVMAAMGPGLDETKARAFCDGSPDHYDWLVAHGVEFKAEFYSEPGWAPAGDEGLMYSGGENAWPFCEIAKPAPRGHLPRLPSGERRTAPQTDAAPAHASERGGGYWLMSPIVEAGRALGVRAEYGVRADALVIDADGRICGVRGQAFGRQVTYRAERAVVLSAGSFIYNDDMVARFAPELLGKPGSAADTHDGHCIRMAQAVGADLGRMDGCEVAAVLDPYLTHRGILVDQFGQRFVTEDQYPGRVSQFIRFRADDQAFLIVDDEIYESSPPGDRMRPTWVAETVEELEREIGLPDGSLVATVELYNRHAANAHDPVFRKRPEWVTPLRPPFGAFDLREVTSGFTLGGLRTSVDGEVIHVGGQPIDGLFACGRTASGIPVAGYASGMSLGDGSFFGRRAGRAAAARSV